MKVGLIYGPSGCGKTSLVRAGVLPRLSQQVVQVYVDCTGNSTTERIRHGLLRVYTELDGQLETPQLVRAAIWCALRDNAIIVIVLDQLEQWLSSHPRPALNDELIQLLSLADGFALQFLLLVRDDFYQLRFRSLLKPIAGKLVRPLQALFADATQRDTLRLTAAIALCDFAGDDPNAMAIALSDASPEQYEIVRQYVDTATRRTTYLQAALTQIIDNGVRGGATQPYLSSLTDGRRRAGAAIALLQMFNDETYRDIFHIPSRLESATQWVASVRPRQVDPSRLVEELLRPSNSADHYFLVQAISQYDRGQLSAVDFERLHSALASSYSADADSGVHAASGWLLRQWGQDESLRVAPERKRDSPLEGQQWYVQIIASNELIWIVFQPGTFVMGSPESEIGRSQSEHARRVTIGHAFAMCDRHVTRKLYEQFANDTGRSAPKISEQSPYVNCPVVKVSWLDAVRFCRWLTAKAGMSEADQCYDDPDRASGTEDQKAGTIATRLGAPGFRLPQEEEWEYACRAGTQTAYFFGDDTAQLVQYAWYLGNSAAADKHFSHPVATLRPNRRGLFDMHGNAWEWCNDRDATANVDNKDEKTMVPVYVICGGSWHSDATFCRSASRYSFPAGTEDELTGFRIVRTLSNK